MTHRQDLTGLTFGFLVVVHMSKVQRKGKHILWDCLCKCGRIVSVASNDIKKGVQQSCGCYRKEVLTTHGMRDHQLYNIYRGMKERCSGKHRMAKYYSDKGVRVCTEWASDPAAFFSWAFLAGWKPGLTVDRIDPNGNYCPENCRFTSVADQNRNKVNTSWVEYGGERLCKEEFIRKYAVVHRDTIRYRMKHSDMSFLDAALTPRRRGAAK